MFDDNNNKQAGSLRRYGPWALVAGASHGIGSEFARQVAAQGLNCILVARTEDTLQSLKSSLEGEYGVKVLIVTQDLSAQDAAARLRSEEHTSELQSRPHLVCRLLLEK